MQNLFLLTAFVTGLLIPGDKPQRTYLSDRLEATTKGKASYYKEPVGMDGTLYLGRIYTMKGVLKAEGHYADAALKVEHGRFRYFHPDGKVESEGDYVMGQKSGVWQRYDNWGQELAEKVYDAEPLKNLVYSLAPTMPSYPGGERAMIGYLRSNVKEAKGATALFVVEKDGALSDIRVLNADTAVAEKVVQALERAPRFEAGLRDGVPVRVQMRVPIK